MNLKTKEEILALWKKNSEFDTRENVVSYFSIFTEILEKLEKLGGKVESAFWYNSESMEDMESKMAMFIRTAISSVGEEDRKYIWRGMGPEEEVRAYFLDYEYLIVDTSVPGMDDVTVIFLNPSTAYTVMDNLDKLT